MIATNPQKDYMLTIDKHVKSLEVKPEIKPQVLTRIKIALDYLSGFETIDTEDSFEYVLYALNNIEKDEHSLKNIEDFNHLKSTVKTYKTKALKSFE